MYFVHHFYLLRKTKVHTNSMKKLNRKRDLSNRKCNLFNVLLFDWFILKVPCKTFWHKHNFQLNVSQGKMCHIFFQSDRLHDS